MLSNPILGIFKFAILWLPFWAKEAWKKWAPEALFVCPPLLVFEFRHFWCGDEGLASLRFRIPISISLSLIFFQQQREFESPSVIVRTRVQFHPICRYDTAKIHSREGKKEGRSCPFGRPWSVLRRTACSSCLMIWHCKRRCVNHYGNQINMANCKSCSRLLGYRAFDWLSGCNIRKTCFCNLWKNLFVARRTSWLIKRPYMQPVFTAPQTQKSALSQRFLASDEIEFEFAFRSLLCRLTLILAKSHQKREGSWVCYPLSSHLCLLTILGVPIPRPSGKAEAFESRDWLQKALIRLRFMGNLSWSEPSLY